jgi:hypothetical protein
MMRVQNIDPLADEDRAKFSDAVEAQAGTDRKHHRSDTGGFECRPDRAVSEIANDQAIDTVPAGFNGEPLYHALESADREILH